MSVIYFRGKRITLTEATRQLLLDSLDNRWHAVGDDLPTIAALTRLENEGIIEFDDQRRCFRIVFSDRIAASTP